MRVLLDSNIFVGGLDKGDPFHPACLDVLEEAFEARLDVVGPVLILAETVCALARRTGEPSHALRAFVNLAGAPAITWLDDSVADVEAAILMGIESGLKGADAIIAHTALVLGVPLVTHDQELKLRAPKGLTVLSAGELAQAL